MGLGAPGGAGVSVPELVGEASGLGWVCGCLGCRSVFQVGGWGLCVGLVLGPRVGCVSAWVGLGCVCRVGEQGQGWWVSLLLGATCGEQGWGRHL